MSRTRLLGLTLLAMLAFAGNSLLCRVALKDTSIDAASFTFLRIFSGAMALTVLAARQPTLENSSGSWASGFALFAYAAAFSFAYLQLSAGTGALLLFGAVQATMIGVGLFRGERLQQIQTLGLLMALGGLVALVLPGVTSPPLISSLLMLSAGIAWGIYSLRGRGVPDPTRATAGNFLRAAPFALLASVATLPSLSIDRAGAVYALASGALASGIGYVIWYTALRELKATEAASVQLSVPVIAAAGGVLLLGEPLSLRLLTASVAILGGIGLVVMRRAR